MTTTPTVFKAALVLGRDPQIFPTVRVSFITVGRDLVPVTQNVIHGEYRGAGHSYWDLIVQPGAVWSTPSDAGWSRAGFPFALVNSLEGETHNGVATFAYRKGKVTNVRVQIVQQTSPFYVVDYFTATAQIKAKWTAASGADFEAARLRYRAELHDRLPIAGWEELTARIPNDLLASFDDGQSAADIVASGIDYNGTIYLKTCGTIAGPLPWCDRARFGVWSATKSLVNEVALLRLAQKYGPSVFEERIVDFVPQAADFPGWKDVRFSDAANMATGLGNGNERTQNDILDGGLENYAPWYEAASEAQKIGAALDGAKPFPWGPGKVARYRDQDMFMLGVAMDNYLKKKAGPAAGVWKMLSEEVFEPIGIHASPINKTIESPELEGQPLMAFGFYPTIGDIVRIARLYQNIGVYQGQQLLYASQIREIFSRSTAPGLPTGQFSPSGQSYYFNAFWKEPYRTAQGCNGYYPQMEGWGGTIVSLFPNKITGIRIAKIWQESGGASSETAGMAAVANHLMDFCPR